MAACVNCRGLWSLMSRSIGRFPECGDPHHRPLRAGQPDQLFDRGDAAQRIGQLRLRDDTRAGPQQARELFEPQLIHVVDSRDAQSRAAALAQQLPGHDVGVVLHLGDEDFIAGLQALPVAGRDHVDGLRAREDFDFHHG